MKVKREMKNHPTVVPIATRKVFMRPACFKFFLATACLALLAGCISTSFKSTKASDYSKQLSSVVIVEAGGLSERYLTLIDRMPKTAEFMWKIFVANGVKASLFAIKRVDLNSAENLRNYLKASNAEHYLQLQVVQTRKSPISLGVDFYDYEATVVEIQSGKEVWKTIVQANFYSSPEDMAKELAALLIKDGLLAPRKTAQ